jgi:hypothetical protein
VFAGKKNDKVLVSPKQFHFTSCHDSLIPIINFFLISHTVTVRKLTNAKVIFMINYQNICPKVDRGRVHVICLPTMMILTEQGRALFKCP